MTEKPNYAVMTVNERLSAAGLTERFDKAILLRKRAEAIAILELVEVANPEKTVDPIFAHPGKYGFY